MPKASRDEGHEAHDDGLNGQTAEGRSCILSLERSGCGCRKAFKHIKLAVDECQFSKESSDPAGGARTPTALASASRLHGTRPQELPPPEVTIAACFAFLTLGPAATTRSPSSMRPVESGRASTSLWAFFI